jgi:hypothetical protein
MSLIPCSACRKRPAEKLAQVTWAWNPEPRERVAYRQKLCHDCFMARLVVFPRDIAPDGPLQCPACGGDTEFDMEPVYATAYVPDIGKLTWELALCSGCSASIRASAQENAELLAEREPVSRGLAPGNSPGTSPWASLGITPRE